jgi:predicted secreted protein
MADKAEERIEKPLVKKVKRRLGLGPAKKNKQTKQQEAEEKLRQAHERFLEQERADKERHDRLGAEYAKRLREREEQQRERSRAYFLKHHSEDVEEI